MHAKTHEIEKQVDTLVHEAKVRAVKPFDGGGWPVGTLCDLKAIGRRGGNYLLTLGLSDSDSERGFLL